MKTRTNINAGKIIRSEIVRNEDGTVDQYFTDEDGTITIMSIM
jgi:hypothetical protein